RVEPHSQARRSCSGSDSAARSFQLRSQPSSGIQRGDSKWKNRELPAMVARERMNSETAPKDQQPRELLILIAVWIVFAALTVLFARQNLSVPGLYYDEAVFAGMAKDFVVGHTHGQHMPDHEMVTFGGRSFPLFVQTYLGALKSWMLIP